MQKGIIEDGTIGNDTLQNKNLWRFRELITDSLSKEGKTFKFDISLPVSSFYSIVEETRRKFSDTPYISVRGFGHLGDGNLHLNIISKRSTPLLNIKELESYVYDWTVKHGGSISSEHGIGLTKANYLPLSKRSNVILLMTSLKNQFDKHGILNPYKLFTRC